MKKRLEKLGLKEVMEQWTYDPKDIFANRIKTQSKPPAFTNKKYPEVEKYANLPENGPFMPRKIMSGVALPKWRSFYQTVATYDGKATSLGSTLNKHMRDVEWSKEKIKAFV